MIKNIIKYLVIPYLLYQMLFFILGEFIKIDFYAKNHLINFIIITILLVISKKNKLYKNNFLRKIEFRELVLIIFLLCLVNIIAFKLDNICLFSRKNIFSQNISMLFIYIFLPINEEFFFRKILFGLSYSRISLHTTNIIISILFFVTHGINFGNWNLFFLSLAIGYVYMSTNSILLAICFHILHNVSIYIYNTINITPFNFQFIYFMIMLCGVCIAQFFLFNSEGKASFI